jgi:hypothetical protein
MSDPLSSGAGKVAEEMMKEVASAIQQAEQLDKSKEAPNVQFNAVMESQQVAQVQEARLGTDNILRAGLQANRTPDVPAIGQTIDSRPVMNGLHRILEDVMQGQNKLEEIINLSLSGRNFSTPELLALQAGVYRFTQELELTSKVVEKATATIKQTMNTQV